jgi:hypothetical protein
MARPRTNPITPIPRDRRLVPSTLRVQSIEREIEKVVTKRMGERLGVDARRLPADLKNVIASAAAAAAQQSVELSVTKDVDEAIGDITRGAVLDKFDSRVDLARKGLDHIAGSSDVQKIMTRRAQMLAEKKKALVAAGFSDEESMDILLADIAARGH